jgi:hypothetical protein
VVGPAAGRLHHHGTGEVRTAVLPLGDRAALVTVLAREAIAGITAIDTVLAAAPTASV